ncbi:membrane protein [Silvimonas iriomotensis]|uniref:Membrane protein n=2 Tax=Silvimonas iriomotensis TaxID=449662 RepID=A0ABQ2PEJ6_9NEIS|nr:membrane protein [Silvimonas iriomotensis]
MTPAMKRAWAQWVAVVCVLLLIALCLVWELWLAPVPAGRASLAWKALPLLLPLRGLLHGRRYTYQWASMFVLLWWTEGLTRAWSDQGISQQLAVLEVIISTVAFLAISFYAKWTRPSVLEAEVEAAEKQKQA